MVFPRLQQVLFAALCALYSHTSMASSLDQFLDLDLEELANYQVVTPTKTGMALSDAPGAITLITYDQIRRSSATTIPELLRLVPGVNVRWNPMVQTIDIRSFGSNPFTSKVLLMIDGIPYNSWNKGGFPQHPGFDFFNIENVKHLEIVRGAGSELYGENALNGVINIVTLSGEANQSRRPMSSSAFVRASCLSRHQINSPVMMITAPPINDRLVGNSRHSTTPMSSANNSCE